MPIDNDHPDITLNAHLAELHDLGIRFVSRTILARAIVATLPYETFRTPEAYADALLAAVDADVRVIGEVAA